MRVRHREQPEALALVRLNDQPDVFQNAQVREQAGQLERAAQPLAAAFRDRGAGHVLAHQADGPGGGGDLAGDQVEIGRLPRLFRNKGYQYEGVIHEQISPSLEKNQAKRSLGDLVITHYGYQREKVQGNVRRYDRNIALLEKQLQRTPDDFYYLYHLALMYKKDDINKAKDVFTRALESGSSSIPQYLRSQIHMRLAQIALEQEDHILCVNESKKALTFDENNVIAKVCNITSLCAIRAFQQAGLMIVDVIENHLDQVGNPNDFINLHKQLKEIGLIS